MLKILDLKSNSWDETKLDRDYYEKLRKTAIEVLGNPEEDQEEERQNEEDQESEVNDYEDDDGKKERRGGDDDLRLEYWSEVEVCGTKISLASDDEKTLEEARLSLTGFFEHYITSS